MELTKEFSPEQYEFALESWTFLDFSGLTPHFTSLFGDVFFQAPDQSWWYLDLVGGTLLPEWPNAVEMVEELQTERGQDQYLLGTIALAGAKDGLELAPTQVYDFLVSPLQGGRIEAQNLIVADFITAVNLIGTLHAEIQARMGEDEDTDAVFDALPGATAGGATAGGADTADGPAA